MCSPLCSTGRATRSVLWRAGPGSGARPPPTTTETTSGASASTVSGHAGAPAGRRGSPAPGGSLPGLSTLVAAPLVHVCFLAGAIFHKEKSSIALWGRVTDRCGAVSSPPPQLQGLVSACQFFQHQWLTSTLVRIAAVPGLQGLVCNRPLYSGLCRAGAGCGGSQCPCCCEENGPTRVLVTRGAQTDVSSQGK